MSYDQNPFAKTDTDRHALWEMLVHRDIDAFISQDWSIVQDDFTNGHFIGIHGHFKSNPDQWRLVFPTINSYRQEWLRQAQETANTKFAEPLRDALFNATTLLDIDVQEDKAVLHKKFDGTIQKANGEIERLNWQTLYFCAKPTNAWVITGFVGYLPFPLNNLA